MLSPFLPFSLVWLVPYVMHFLLRIWWLLLLLSGLFGLFLLLTFLMSNGSGYFRLALAKVFQLDPHHLELEFL